VTLPVDEVLPALKRALEAHPCAVLQAPPGAGKTTRVPLALLDAPWLGDLRIIMLEPRRVAARAAAGFMARSMNDVAGGVVGYRTRRDTRVGPRTRIEVVTEGVLTRMLGADPALEGYGLVVFDEFHERSLHADTGLALALETQSLLQPALRILVMSATLDGARVAALMGGAPIVTSEGRSHPVSMTWLPRPPDRPLEGAVAGAVLQALDEGEGDVLVFLPGQREINRMARTLAERAKHASIVPLHGMLPPGAQDRALVPDPAGRRKVILATSIAETSLTIDGVRAVVDSGLARVPRYSPRTGLTRLATVRASRAATEQRAGRAGRQAPGRCYRVWAAHEQLALVPYSTPEIEEADLAPMLMALSAAGALDPGAMRWLDPPPPAHLALASALLAALGMRDARGALTRHGKACAALAMHPRLAHMVVTATARGEGTLARAMATLLEERDAAGLGVPDARALLLGKAGEADVSRAGAVAALAFPDRVAWRRPGTNRFLLRNGRGATLEPPHALAGAEFIVALDLDDRGAEGRIFLAAPIDRTEVEEEFAGEVTRHDVVEIEDGVVRARREVRLGAITLGAQAVRDPDPRVIAATVVEHEARSGLRSLLRNEGFQRLRQRMAFLHALDGTWPGVTDPVILEQLGAWLPMHNTRLMRLDDLAHADLAGMLLAMLDWEKRHALEELAPTHYTLPRGARVPIDYAEPSAPVLAVKLQELFGVRQTPTVAGGRVRLTLHLLSPARRPVQVTTDLAGFWRGSYAEVRKDLRGRYPRHAWPEDPLGS